jgi:hypothetical protein
MNFKYCRLPSKEKERGYTVVIIWLCCLYSLKLSSYLLLNGVTYICLHWTKNLQSAKVWYFVTSSLLSSHSWGQRGSFS